MSAAVNQFVEHARQVPEPKISQEHPRVTFDGQSTFMKFCAECHEQMPHIRREDYSECVLCGTRTFSHAAPGPE